jgi:glyoxylase I family protein
MSSPLVQIDPKKDGIDIGIAITDWEATKKFYCETLGFTHVMDMPFPLNPGTMHRVQAGSTTLKFADLETSPKLQNPPGGPSDGIGIRYFTFWTKNVAEITEKCIAAGYKVALPLTVVRVGVTIVIIEDPDGNWVEFLQSE